MHRPMWGLWRRRDLPPPGAGGVALSPVGWTQRREGHPHCYLIPNLSGVLNTPQANDALFQLFVCKGRRGDCAASCGARVYHMSKLYMCARQDDCMFGCCLTQPAWCRQVHPNTGNGNRTLPGAGRFSIVRYSDPNMLGMMGLQLCDQRC